MVQSNRKVKNNIGRTTVRKVSSINKQIGSRTRNQQNTLNSTNKTRSSTRAGHIINNSANRHGRSTNAIRGSIKRIKRLSSINSQKRKKTLTNRLNSKNNNNNNRQQQIKSDQQKNKPSLISTTTTSNLVQPVDDEYHRESNFATNE
ncbi:unnamed protein product [Rotaria sordida]|uniref:Uncharacterized protein n=1 Tax=Rotaria sordida TaxID=392033 RepID=A0A819PT82_9BILA|nr:unnamed protein product [Rotaria sordida]CAF0823534.1 unnamed protein product [Rotaria sordida]CAF3873959.1 unnamed protein product [Rotaria sordida]CAF4019313.1 unnamed protein product [Rotaria sordida]